jgi:hypothetical protein
MTRAIYAAAVAAATKPFEMPLSRLRRMADVPRYVMSEMTRNEIACATATSLGKARRVK